VNKKRLGNSDLWLSRLGLGTWAIGGKQSLWMGCSDDNDSIQTIQRAIDLGINWIDTAKGYGHGHSEEIIGQASRDVVIGSSLLQNVAAYGKKMVRYLWTSESR
jgi:aryl-alcohol dehydrogenase-like predicted oxidoreductase